MPRPLFLRSHVFLCRGKRHWTILDVNRDQYLCVDRRQFEALGPLLSGWDEGTSHPGSLPAEAHALANSLLSASILTARPAADSKEARATIYPLPTHALDLEALTRTNTLLPNHLVHFFSGCRRASRDLQRQSFHRTVEFVRARKLHKASRMGFADVEYTRSLVSIFDRLRLFYPRPYLCLFDSLALIHFLARFGVFPDWVFGVNPDPFEAHCWVQAGNVVLNDTVERVSALTPIMCV